MILHRMGGNFGWGKARHQRRRGLCVEPAKENESRALVFWGGGLRGERRRGNKTKIK